MVRHVRGDRGYSTFSTIRTMRQPSSSSLEFALLGMLAYKPHSGYDLRRAFANTPIGHFSDSPGAIYPALRRLKARKWVTAAREKQSARNREVFQISPTGQQALLHWLKQPFGRTEVVHGLDTLLLRFAFFDGNLSRRETCQFLADLERELGAYINELERYAATSGFLSSLNTGALAFSNGLTGYRAHRSWVRRARRMLSGSGMNPNLK